MDTSNQQRKDQFSALELCVVSEEVQKNNVQMSGKKWTNYETNKKDLGEYRRNWNKIAFRVSKMVAWGGESIHTTRSPSALYVRQWFMNYPLSFSWVTEQSWSDIEFL